MGRLALVLLALTPAALAGQAGTWEFTRAATFQGQPSQLTARLTLIPAGTYEAQLVNAPAEGPAFYLWSGGQWTTVGDRLCVTRTPAAPRCAPFRLTSDTLVWGPFAFAAVPPAAALEVPR